jgi:hypothetical protein
MTTHPCLLWTWFPDEFTAAEAFGFEAPAAGWDERADLSDRAAEEFLADNTEYVFPAHGVLVRPF